MREPSAAAAVALLAVALAAGPVAVRAAPASAWQPPQAAPHLGHPVSNDAANRSSLNVYPDGRGLPPGRGSVQDGAVLFQQQCAGCHGSGGRGATAEELAGGTEPLTSEFPDKTIGLYWPYATTLFDFIRRSKPMTAPGTLSNDQVYALTAYLLQANGLLDAGASLDAATLAKIKMPNRDGFIGVDAAVPARR